MADKDKVLVVTEDSQERLLEYIKKASQINDDGWQLKNRLEIVDRNYMLEADQTEEQRKAKLSNISGDPTKLQNMQVPMIMESIENTVGFFTNVWCTDYPMFKFGSDGNQEDICLQWNTLVGEDQVHYGWVAEFVKWFRNLGKYNFAPMEVDWCQEINYKVSNGTGDNGTKLEQVNWRGNRFTALDPYNTIYDSRVEIHKAHKDGEFAGYVRRMTRIQVKRLIAGLGDKRLKNDKKAYETPSYDVSYYTPIINKSVFVKNKNWSDGNFNWINWVTDTAQGHIAYQNMYTVVILYARIMPYEFGIRAPQDQTPDIWKLISVNGVLVFAEPMPNAHDYLPIILGQSIVDNLDHQTKSQGENQLPFQAMTSALWNAKLASARRRTTDRMLYNPLLIDPDHINSSNPSAKIPIRPTAYGRKLEEAVYVFPFNDDNGQLWLQEADGVAKWGMRANGQNNASVGQFQKGNKLDAEWKQTMANAGNTERSKALVIENTAIQAFKEIIKSNYLQFAPDGDLYNRQTEKVVTIDMSKLRQTAAEFKVGDGLLPIERLVGADVMQSAMNYLQQSPGIGQDYNEGDMFAYLMKLQGVQGLEQFKKTPEQQQYEQALRAWTQAAVEIAKQIKIAEMPIEKAQGAVQSIIGPMPQPPKPATPPNAAEQQLGVGNAAAQPS